MSSKIIQFTASVSGVSCMHCVNTIQKNVEQVEGVKTAKVNLEKKELSVEYDSDKVTRQQIAQVVKELGYEME